MDTLPTFCKKSWLMKNILSLLLLALAVTGLSACNTVKGVGQDVSATGHDLSKAASTVERKIQN
jgi:predicted small secreted protein